MGADKTKVRVRVKPGCKHHIYDSEQGGVVAIEPGPGKFSKPFTVTRASAIAFSDRLEVVGESSGPERPADDEAPDLSDLKADLADAEPPPLSSLSGPVPGGDSEEGGPEGGSDPYEGVEFASPEARAKAEEFELERKWLDQVKPSKKTGYGTDDIEAAVLKREAEESGDAEAGEAAEE